MGFQDNEDAGELSAANAAGACEEGMSQIEACEECGDEDVYLILGICESCNDNEIDDSFEEEYQDDTPDISDSLYGNFMRGEQ